MHTSHIYSLSFSFSLSLTHTHTQTHTYPNCELIQIPPRLLYAKLHFPLTEFALALYFFLVLLSLCNLSITYYSTHSVACIFNYTLKIVSRGRSQDGGGVGRGEHFLPHKFIKRAFKRRVHSTKQLLNASRGHQAPRKATQLFERR